MCANYIVPIASTTPYIRNTKCAQFKRLCEKQTEREGERVRRRGGRERGRGRGREGGGGREREREREREWESERERERERKREREREERVKWVSQWVSEVRTNSVTLYVITHSYVHRRQIDRVTYGQFQYCFAKSTHYLVWLSVWYTGPAQQCLCLFTVSLTLHVGGSAIASTSQGKATDRASETLSACMGRCSVHGHR